MKDGIRSLSSPSKTGQTEDQAETASEDAGEDKLILAEIQKLGETLRQGFADLNTSLVKLRTEGIDGLAKQVDNLASMVIRTNSKVSKVERTAEQAEQASKLNSEGITDLKTKVKNLRSFVETKLQKL